MKMKLYSVSPLPMPECMIVAETTSEAGQIFTTYAVATGAFRLGKLRIERMDNLIEEKRMPGLEDMLERGVPGVAHFTNFGWSLKPPG